MCNFCKVTVVLCPTVRVLEASVASQYLSGLDMHCLPLVQAGVIQLAVQTIWMFTPSKKEMSDGILPLDPMIVDWISRLLR